MKLTTLSVGLPLPSFAPKENSSSASGDLPPDHPLQTLSAISCHDGKGLAPSPPPLKPFSTSASPSVGYAQCIDFLFLSCRLLLELMRTITQSGVYYSIRHDSICQLPMHKRQLLLLPSFLALSSPPPLLSTSISHGFLVISLTHKELLICDWF